MMYSSIGRRATLRAALAAAGATALGVRPLAAAPAAKHAQRAWPASLPAADVPLEYRTPGGHYFGQTGFAVVDEAGGPQFWAGMRHLGGIQVLGYPISRPYLGQDGLQYQAFQRGVLQWRPDSGETWLANVMDWLHDGGHDDWLLSLGVPRQRNDDGSLTDFAQIKAARLRWLTNAPIKRYFMQAGAAQPSPIDSTERGIAVYGLPTSLPEQHGPFIAQRFQRGVLQYWTAAIPGLPLKGTVVGALAGDLARQAGIFPAAATAAAAPPVPAVIGHVALSRSSVAQGRTVVVHLWAPQARRIAGTIGHNPLLLAQRGSWWVGIGGVERLAAVGSLPLRLVAEDQHGTLHAGPELVEHVAVSSGHYPLERFWIGQAQLALLTPEAIAHEVALLREATTQLTPQRLWSGAFQRPLNAPITSPFGARRSINGGPANTAHGGVDYGAATGTPVPACATGRVALAEGLTIRGNAVYLDHGLGVYSGYLHLSQLHVRVGEPVERGQIIGQVGATGFANGPHLHWEVRVGGVNVAPVEWIVPGAIHDL